MTPDTERDQSPITRRRFVAGSLVTGASDVANMGATFVGPTQTQILGLMSELGIGKFDVYSTGNLLWYESGKSTPYTGTIPPARDPASVIELGEVLLPQIDQMAQTVPLDSPWTAPDALPWDSMTVARAHAARGDDRVRPGPAGPGGPHPLGRTETATVWTGYMDGAVQAGKRAAGEALTGL
jgi:hypothetical protein